MQRDRAAPAPRRRPAPRPAVRPVTWARQMVLPRWLAGSMRTSPPSAARRALDAASRAAVSLAKLPTWMAQAAGRAGMRGRADRLRRQRRGVRGADQAGQAARHRGPALRRHIHLLEPLVEQRRHVGVALGVGAGAQHDADQAHAAAHGAGDQVVPGRLGVAGLHAVGAGIGLQHPVVVEDHAAAEGEARRAEIRDRSRGNPSAGGAPGSPGRAPWSTGQGRAGPRHW